MITTIREATTWDVPRIVEMGGHFLANSSYAKTVAYNPGQMALTAERVMADPNGVILVADRHDARYAIGMIALWIFPHYFSGVLTAAELVFWVEPEWRGCGLKLLKAAEAWTLAHGAIDLQLIAPTAEIGNFYARLGYTQVETAYQKDVTVCRQRQPPLSAAR